MKNHFYFIILLLFIGCKSKSQKDTSNNDSNLIKHQEIISYLNTKSITDYYNKKDKEIIIGSSFDSTNTLGIFQVVFYDELNDITNLFKEDMPLKEKRIMFDKYKKTAFFIEKKDVDKVPLKHVEGLAVGWEYDMVTPCKVSIFEFQNELWKFKTDSHISENKEYYNLRNSIKSLNNINKNNLDLTGNYSLFQDLGKIDDVGISIGYNIKITRDSCFFSGQGYQTNFYDLCTVKQNKDTLELHYNRTIEGTNYNNSITSPLVKLYKKGNDYYVKSPVIFIDSKPNKDIKIEKEN
ncbi:DUF5991 domain-containing protein [Aquimarina muelleri]|uniref:DUF5991 domain-containing protein n=1 Tax=Aquimarina muelleri TaxID=279356 RepID=UPI003F68741E